MHGAKIRLERRHKCRADCANHTARVRPCTLIENANAVRTITESWLRSLVCQHECRVSEIAATLSLIGELIE